MTRMRTFGLILSLIGVGIALFATYVMQRLDVIRARIDSSSETMGRNPIASIAKAVANNRVDQYDALVMGGLIGGGVLTLIGLWVLIFGAKKKTR